MAVAVEMRFKGATTDQYDAIAGNMGHEPEGRTPPGAISHWVAETDEGLLIVDVWESKAQYEQFAQEQIGPFAAEAGITGPPEIRFYDVHNYLTKG